MTMLDYALQYHAAGFSVIPITPGDKRPPLVAWQEFQQVRATRDLIKKWWTDCPSANIGIVTGGISGVNVLDVDTRHGGDLLKFTGVATPRVQTPSGGQHLFFVADQQIGSPVGVLPGVDVRGDGGYVVAPPSVTSVGEYKFLDRCRHPFFEEDRLQFALWTSITHLLVTEPTSDSDREPWIAGVLREGAPIGEQSNTLVRLAGYFAARGVPADITNGLLWGWLQRCDWGAEPWTEQHVEGITDRIYKKEEGRDRTTVEITGLDVASDRKAHLARCLRTSREIMAERPQDLEWLVEGMVARGAYSEVVGLMKTGKSTLVCALLRALLHGEGFLGRKTMPAPVLYLTEQSGPSLAATLERGRIAEEDQLFVITAPDLFGCKWDEGVSTLIELAEERGVQLIVVDTLSHLAGIEDENRASDAQKALAPFGLARKKEIAVLFVRHERKGGGNIAQAGRGSGAFSGEMDIMMRLKTPRGNDSYDDSGDDDDMTDDSGKRRLDLVSRLSPAETLHLQYTGEESGGFTTTTPPKAGRRAHPEKVLNALTDEWQGVREISAACGLGEVTVRRHLIDALKREESDFPPDAVESRVARSKGCPTQYRKPQMEVHLI